MTEILATESQRIVIEYISREKFELHQRVLHQETQIQEFQTCISQLKSRLSSKDRAISCLNHQVEILKASLKERQQRQIRIQKWMYTRELQAAESRIEQLNRENATLIEDLETEKDRFKKLESLNDRLVTEILNVKKFLTIALKIFEKSEEEEEDEHLIVERMRRDIKPCAREIVCHIRSLKKELGHRQTKIEDLKSKNTAITDIYEKIIDKYLSEKSESVMVLSVIDQSSEIISDRESVL